MAKKKQPVSGVDLTNLSLEQLKLLQGEIFQKTEKLLEDQHENSLAEAKQSGRFQELKDQAKALRKELRLLAKGGQFELVLPIRFSFKGEINDSNPFDPTQYDDAYGTLDIGDFVNFEFKAKLDTSKLNKSQSALLNDVVNDYAQDACEDIWHLVPENMLVLMNDWQKRFDTFIKEFKAEGFKPEDFQ